MGEVRVNIYPAKSMSLRLRGSTAGGSGATWTAIVGRIAAEDMTFRHVVQWGWQWPADAYQLREAWFRPHGASGDLAAIGSGYGFGSNPRIRIQELDAGFIAGGGGQLSWPVTAATVWPGPSLRSGSAIVNSGAIANPNQKQRIDVRSLVADIMPTSILRPDGSPGGGLVHHGWRIWSPDEDNQTHRWAYALPTGESHPRDPFIELVFDDRSPPEAPQVDVPVRGDPTVVASPSGTALRVEITARPRAGDTTTRIEVEVYADGATDATPGSRLGYLSAVPTATGAPNAFAATLNGLPPRTILRFRVRTHNQKGVAGPWTPLADGRIRTAYVPGVPLNPTLSSDPSDARFGATLATSDPGDYITGWSARAVRWNADGSATNLWPNLGVIEIGGETTRADVPWDGIGLIDGDRVSHQQQLRNRDGVPSPWTTEQTTTMRTRTGPRFVPDGPGTKITARTGPVTITNDVPFGSFRYRLYRGDLLIHTSPIIGASGDEAEIVLPAGRIEWGDLIGIEGEVREEGQSDFGQTSQRTLLQFVTLPVTSLTPGPPEERGSGDVIGTTDVEWHLPYSDPDVQLFGEEPVAQELEIREAATPQGSGALVRLRTNVAQGDHEANGGIPEYVRTGRQVLALDDDTGWDADADVSVGMVASAPDGYTGDSLRITFASSDAERTAGIDLDPPLDLSQYGSGAIWRLWARISSKTNLAAMDLSLASADGWITYGLHHAYRTPDTGTWYERPFSRPSQDAHSGTFDWSAITRIHIYCTPDDAAYAGTLDLRDLRHGTALEFETAYDVRGRYRDDADPRIETALADDAEPGDDELVVADATGLVVGMEVTVGGSLGEETRTITDVDGTTLTLSSVLDIYHEEDAPVYVHHWGVRTPWRRVTVSEPPIVTALSPADGASVEDPTPDLSFSFTSPGGKDMAFATLLLYRRDAAGQPALLYERDVTAETVTLPILLLDDGAEYEWEVIAYDTDGLAGITERWMFRADIARPAAPTDLVAVADPTASTVTLTWEPAVSDELLALDDDEGWTAGTDAAVDTADDQPDGYEGDSLELTFDSSDAERRVTYTFPEPLDLTEYPSDAALTLWVHTTLATTTHLVLADGDGAESLYAIVTTGDPEDEWFQASVSLDDPGTTDGPDLADIGSIAFMVPAADDAYALTLMVRDLRIGGDTHFDHWRVFWKDAGGQDMRLDGGPVTVEDGRVPLTATSFVTTQPRLGDNELLVAAHNGVRMSDPARVEVRLDSARPGAAMIVTADDPRHTFPFTVTGASLSEVGHVETVRVPSRPGAVHRHFGSAGRRASVRVSWIPREDGALSPRLRELYATGLAHRVKLPTGWDFDVLLGRMSAMSDTIEDHGIQSASVEVDEVQP